MIVVGKYYGRANRLATVPVLKTVEVMTLPLGVRLRPLPPTDS